MKKNKDNKVYNLDGSVCYELEDITKEVNDIIETEGYIKPNVIYDEKGSPTYINDGLKTKTDISQAVDCDLQKIINNYMVMGQPLPIQNWTDFDLSDIPTDYYEATNHINEVNYKFINSVPAEVRALFKHNPSNFYKFAIDPKNEAQLQEWGIITPKMQEQKLDTPQSQAEPKEQ